MSEMIKLKFPDGAIKEFPKGTTTEESRHQLVRGFEEMHLQENWMMN